MQKALTLIALIICNQCFAQCPFAVTLQNNGICLGRDTLSVSAPGSTLSKILWYNGNSSDTTVTAVVGNVYNPNAVTVAGGNGNGSNSDQFESPRAIYVDASGSFYVADWYNHRVLKFPPGSTSATIGITVAGGNGPGAAANQLNTPSSVYVDAAGNLFVADEMNSRIQKFPPGSSSTTDGITVAGGNGAGSDANQLNQPLWVYADGGGNLYVADGSNVRVQKFPPGSSSASNGVTVAGGNGRGAAANQFNSTISIALDAVGNLYVADGSNYRVQKFPAGSTAATGGITVAGGNGWGTAPDQLGISFYIFVDGAGNLYVADADNNRVQKFLPGSLNGITVAGGNGQGAAAYQLNFPVAVYVGTTGNMLVSDESNDRIQSFSTTTTIDTVFTPSTPGTYTAVVTNTAGCTDTTNAITIYPTVTPAISIAANAPVACAAGVLDTVHFTANPTNGGTSPVYQWQVNGVKAGASSPAFTAAVANNSVITCTLTSNAACATTPMATSLPDTVRFTSSGMATLKNNGGVCLGSSTLVVSAPGGVLSKILWYNGSAIDTVVTAGSTAIGITVAGGNGAGGKANQLQQPAGLYVDAGGNVYVADAVNQRIQKFPAGSTSATPGVTVAGGNLAGNANNQLNMPNGVFVDAGGNIYIADTRNHRIQKFPPGSTSATSGKTLFGRNDSGSTSYMLTYPEAVFIDGAGYIYVADAGNNRIQKFTPGYAFATTVAGGNGKGPAANQLSSPASVFVDGQGNVYVADFGNNRIQKFPPGSDTTTDGITVAGDNGSGSAANQLYYPDGIFMDASGNLYVSDYANGRIQKFPPNSTSATNGVTVAGGNGQGAAANQLNGPAGLIVDASGNVYVADAANNRVQKFPPGGVNTIDTLFKPTAPGTYYAVVTGAGGCKDTTDTITLYPTVTPAITITGKPNIANPCAPVIATGSFTFTTNTAYGGAAPVYQWWVNGTKAGTDSTGFTTTLGNGDAVYCLFTSNAVCAANPTVKSNVYTVAFSSPLTASLQKNAAVCIGSDTLFVSTPGYNLSKIVWYNGNAVDTTVHARVKYAPNGVTVAGGNGPGNNANQLYAPGAVYVNSDGSFYVADEQNNRIQKFPSGSSSVSYGATVAGGNGQGAAANQLNSPHSVVTGTAGNIYIADIYNNRIQQFPPGSTSATNGITAAGGNGNGNAPNQLSAPACAFMDANGNLYVADQVNNRIQKFPPGSTSLSNGVTVAGGNGTGSAANQFNIPYAVFVDGGGSIYVTDQANARIQKFPPGSTSATDGITVAGGNGQGTDANQLTSPLSVYVDGDGNIFVADLGNNRIQKFLPGNPNGTTVAGGNGRGSAANQLNAPAGLYADARGNIYVADQDNDRIQEFYVDSTLSIDTAFAPASPGSYTAVVTDSAGCTDTSNAVIIPPPTKAVVSIVADTTAICAGKAVAFTATATNAGALPVYQWLVNGVVEGPNSPAYTASALANGDSVACAVSSIGGCILPDTSASIVITVWPVPVVGQANDVSILPGQSAAIALPVTGSIATYLWLPPTGLNTNTVANPVASPAQTTSYTLAVTSVNGCTASGSIKVYVVYPIMVPNAFTPNGDGHNDIFYVLGGNAGDKIKDFAVYSRWGGKLFHVQNVLPNTPAVGWDGNYNGLPQQPGTYVYVVTVVLANGTEKVFKGAVVLVR